MGMANPQLWAANNPHWWAGKWTNMGVENSTPVAAWFDTDGVTAAILHDGIRLEDRNDQPKGVDYDSHIVRGRKSWNIREEPLPFHPQLHAGARLRKESR